MTGRGDEGGRSLSGGHLPGPVGTDEYIAAWSVLVERPLSFDEFSDLPMPPGCTPVELWRHFAALRRVAGVTMGVKPWFRVDRDVSWAFVPKSTQLALNQIMSMSYPDSALNAFVRQGGRADYGLLPFVVDEVYSLARRDGLTELNKTALQAIWTGERAPETPAERIVANLSELFAGAARVLRQDRTARPVLRSLLAHVGLSDELLCRTLRDRARPSGTRGRLRRGARLHLRVFRGGGHLSEGAAAHRRQGGRPRKGGRVEYVAGLNRRQKDFLLVAQRNPAMSIKLKHYAELYGVVYATARADLLDLVEKGYLSYRKEGRAFVFSGVAGRLG